MKVFFTVITAIAALALVYWRRNVTHNDRPCVPNPDNNAYKKFAYKHILQGPVPTNIQQWQKYLIQNGLCNKPLQTFLQQADKNRVVSICNGDGERMPPSYQGNLCISNAQMQVYEVRVTNTNECTIQSNPVPNQKYVIVACDKVDNQCRPVHFEGSRGQLPNNRGPTCHP